MSRADEVKEVVREKYGEAALRVTTGRASCCGSAPTALDCCDPITSNLYEAAQAGEVPDDAMRASLGCGNPTALAELKPGGRLAVSDVVVRGEVPPAIRRSMELWVGCVAGALSDADYRSKLAAAGFTGIELEVTRVYGSDDARTFLAAEGFVDDAVVREMDGKFVSAFIRAVKPAPCCGPGCCTR